MSKLICQKCGGEISNDFGVTLFHCTNCGASIESFPTENPAAFDDVQTLVSPKSPNYNPQSNSKMTRNVLGCLGLGAILLAAVGIVGYIYWPGKNPLAKFTNQYTCTIEGEPEPATSEDYYNRARKHIESDKYEDLSGFDNGSLGVSLDNCAFGALDEALRLDPNNAKALVLRGNGYSWRDKSDLALSDFDKAIQIEPNNLLAHRFRGQIYKGKRQFDKAIEDLSKLIELSANGRNKINRFYVYEERGSCYLEKREYEAAVRDFDEAIRIQPDKNTYLLRSTAYLELGKKDLAEADSQKANEFDKPKTSPSPTNPNTAKTVSGGVLNGKAINFVQPVIPPVLKVMGARGEVKVQVIIDENGNVISALAITGKPLLWLEAQKAARALKFSPTLLSGKPVKVSGVIVFNFVAE